MVLKWQKILLGRLLDFDGAGGFAGLRLNWKVGTGKELRKRPLVEVGCDLMNDTAGIEEKARMDTG